MHSAWLVVMEWKGTNWMSRIPYLVMKSCYSPKVKTISLCITKVNRREYVVNSFLGACMVSWEEAVDTVTTSSHFE